MRTDILIIGAGMAGASLAAAIGDAARVMLIEAEAHPGLHATGRSAAFWSETYGGPAVQPLTSASGPWLAERGFLQPRGCLHIADSEGAAALDELEHSFAGQPVALVPLDRTALERDIPGLRPGWNRGLSEPSCTDIDVAALHALYLRTARQAGATLLCDARAEAMERRGGGWRVTTRAGAIDAGVIVNAAGAWATPIALLAGAAPIAVTPYRRTIVQLVIDPPAPVAMPLIMDASERFYFKPEAGGRLWLSPHDETRAMPGDAAPEEMDIAVAIDRLGRVVDWHVRRKERAWAGLRSFAPDRAPVYGFDVRAPGFFWFAGQGGFGIQTAPAAAMLAAALVLGRAPDAAVAGIDAARYAPDRFAD